MRAPTTRRGRMTRGHHRPARLTARPGIVRERGTCSARGGEITAEMAFIAEREGVPGDLVRDESLAASRDPGQPQPSREPTDDRQGLRGEGRTPNIGNPSMVSSSTPRRWTRWCGPSVGELTPSWTRPPAGHPRTANGFCATPAPVGTVPIYRAGEGQGRSHPAELEVYRDTVTSTAQGVDYDRTPGAAIPLTAERVTGIVKWRRHWRLPAPGTPPRVVPVHQLR